MIEKNKKGVPFQRSLLLNLTVGIVVLGLCVLLTSLWATNRAAEQLSAALTRRVIATTDAKLQGFYEPVQIALEITAERVAKGEFESFPLESLDSFFAPMVRRVPQLSSISYAHADGDEYMLLQDADVWRSRHTRPERWGGVAEWREWEPGARDRPIKRRRIDYDARTRPWFAGAMARFEGLSADASMRERIHWTAPYKFFTSGQPGLTASLAHKTVTGRTIVLGFDILLEEISRFTSQLAIGERGKVFVLRGDPAVPTGLVVVGLPADERFVDKEAMVEFVLSPPDELGGPVASFVQRVADGGDEAVGIPISFIHKGEEWWGALEKSQLRTTANVWVGSVVPESELLEGLPNTNLIVIVITGLIIALAVRRSFRLAKRYAEPIEELTESGNRMQRLNFEPIEPVESNISEIRHLGTTLERMRSALQSYSAAREDTRVAKTIRSMTLPESSLTNAGLEISAWHEPAMEVGGECFDIVELTDASADARHAGGGVVIAHFDCPGTGVSAALFGTQLRAAFRAAAREDQDPEAIARQLQGFLQRDLPQCCPVGAWILRLQLGESPRLEALGFGLGAIVLHHANQSERIECAGHSLGLPFDAGLPATVTRNLQAGDLVVLASDGVLDAMESQRSRFGVTGLERQIRELGDGTAADLVAGISNRLQEYPATPSGDRTLVVIRVLAEPGSENG